MVCDECGAMSFDDDVCDECGCMILPPEMRDRPVQASDFEPKPREA